MVIKDYLSPSSARELDKGIAHLVEYWNRPKNTKHNPSIALGNAYESGVFGKKFPVFVKPEPHKSMNLGANRAAMALMEPNQFINQKQDLILAAMLHNTRAIYSKFLKTFESYTGAGKSGNLCGVEWRGVPDFMGTESVLEVKAMAVRSMHQLNREILTRLYHVQMRVYEHLFGFDRSYLLVCSTTPPYLPQIFELSEQARDAADAKIAQLSERFLAWKQLGCPMQTTLDGSGWISDLILPIYK